MLQRGCLLVSVERMAPACFRCKSEVLSMKTVFVEAPNQPSDYEIHSGKLPSHWVMIFQSSGGTEQWKESGNLEVALERTSPRHTSLLDLQGVLRGPPASGAISALPPPVFPTHHKNHQRDQSQQIATFSTEYPTLPKIPPDPNPQPPACPASHSCVP